MEANGQVGTIERSSAYDEECVRVGYMFFVDMGPIPVL